MFELNLPDIPGLERLTALNALVAADPTPVTPNLITAPSTGEQVDVGFLSKILKVVDNPLTRASLSSLGYGQAAGAIAAAAGNQAAASALLGGSYGSVFSGGPAVTPTFNTQIQGRPMMLGNSLFPTLPGVSGGGGATGTWTPTAAASRGSYYMGADGKVHRRRRMNPANIKAARRAIRRIRSTRRILQRIERLLPTRTVHARSRAPSRRR